jgi:colicin import membrane protein
MGEPEFFLHKNQLTPPRPVLSKDEEEEISQKVQIPTNQIPEYNPEHMLSPEFSGLSNYERGVKDNKQELEDKLQHLKQNPQGNENQIKLLEDELNSLDYLYENYNIGMNVFRTAKGGRKKLKA